MTTFRYDVEGNLTWVRNGRGQVYQQIFDRSSRAIGAINFEGVVLSGVLDAKGNMISSRTPVGTTVSEFDDFGNLVGVEYADGEVVKLDHLVGAGVTRIDNGRVLVERWYDPASQVVEEHQDSHVVRMLWRGGRVTKIGGDVGLGVTFTPDILTSAVRIAVGSVEIIHRQHEANDFLTSFGDQLVLRRKLGPTGLLDKQWLTRRAAGVEPHDVATDDDPNVLFSIRYEYDESQLLRREHRSDNTMIEYDVDAADHIVERRTWARGQVVSTERIAYDMAGSPQVEGAGYDDLARPVRLGDETFAYDGEGRLVERRTDRGIWQYEWSTSCCLTRVTSPKHVVEMDYDGRGRRMRKRVLREGEVVASISYVWTNQTVLHEVDEITGSSRTYAREDDRWEPLGHVDVSAGVEAPCFYVLDPCGALDFAVDSRGDVVFAADRTIFGDYHPSIATTPVSVRFQNQHYDEDVGLTYTRFRWFDARLGLFVSRDPIELDGNINPRDYASNPRRFVDPLGLTVAQPSNPAPDPNGHPPRPPMPDPANMTGDQTNTYLTQPGYAATNGTTGTPGYVVADATERSGRGFRGTTTTTIDNAGTEYGCHSCGRKRDQINTEDGSFGHWRKDHQPPLSHVEAGDNARRNAGLPQGVVRIYPQCPRCSSTQGGLLASRPPSAADAARAAQTMNPRDADAARTGPPRGSRS